MLPDLEGEDDEGEELSPGEVDEERIEEALEEGFGFLSGTAAVWCVSVLCDACHCIDVSVEADFSYLLCKY